MTEKEKSRILKSINEAKDSVVKSYMLVDSIKDVFAEFDSKIKAHKADNDGELDMDFFSDVYDGMRKGIDKCLFDADMEPFDYDAMAFLMYNDDEVSGKLMTLTCAEWAFIYMGKYPLKALRIIEKLNKIMEEEDA